jgi:hypothetical protein
MYAKVYGGVLRRVDEALMRKSMFNISANFKMAINTMRYEQYDIAFVISSQRNEYLLTLPLYRH